jgi:hypothetical protein
LQSCGFDKIATSKELKIKGWEIVEKDTHNKIVRIEVKKVNEQDAKFIESELHYLRSYREDGVYRIGVFIEGYSFPICYMSFCAIDRSDKEEAIKKALQQQDFDSSKTIELSRVFGCGKLPKNTISFLVSQGAEYFRERGYEYMITAVNPYMGFAGISMLASNFIPFAIRPVKYQYATNGEYITIRSSENKKPCKMKMPFNILYIQEIQKTNKMQPVKFIHINEDDTIKQDIHKLRGSLENVWSDETRYHGTILHGNDHPSKGQCGVSSMYLAKHLQSEGYDVKFCEGNVFFEDGTSILNHCWIKLRKKNTDYIIDITADQNGYNQEVIFNKVQDLKNSNIRYESTREIENIDKVGVEHLILRLAHLENELINK